MSAHAASALGVNGLSVRFGHTEALRDVTLEAQPGQVTAIVGGDGAGKSTLLRALAGRVQADAGDIRTVDRTRFGYQPATSGVWPTLTVQENLEFVGRSYGMPAARIRSRSAELLERAGLADADRRLGNALSGGMRQKLGFLLAILHEPELVLLDEPSTGVDPVSRVELWRLISATAGSTTNGTATTVVMATTYLDEAQRAAAVLALDAGRTLAAGTPDEIIASVPGSIATLDDPDAVPSAIADRTWRRGTERHVWWPPETGELAASTRVEHPDFEDALIALSLAAHPDPGVKPNPPVEPPPPVEPVETKPPRVEARPVSAETRPVPGFDRRDQQSSDAAAAARHITKHFGHATALDDVSLDVRPGEVVGLIGANGAGKTTLLRIMLGLERADEGEATLFGALPSNASRRRLGYVPQGLGLYTTLSVRENVAFLSRVYDVPKPQLPGPLLQVRSAVVGDIGLGRQRQLAFVLALSHGPELLVLDEPTSGVDPLARARLWDVIHAQADAGRAVIVTTHYLQEAEQCTRLALLSQGRMVGSGRVHDLTAGARAVLVTSDDPGVSWQRLFEVLDRSGLPIMLSGRSIRVAGRAEKGGEDALRDDVVHALAGIRARVQPVPATLEETMVLLDREASASLGAAEHAGTAA
ncbi:ATP-binding cassette domain-containing protein [Rathayibacter sp. KR2-224]|uniref:ATP-binding cassette domain-containing protein n=1 Tax=Rathayibacter sp. KR2-224 TaxID=3400913 RepID=UPI003C0F1785